MSFTASDNPVLLDMMKLLRTLPRKEQIALHRFYAAGESENGICAELGLRVEDFRQLRHEIRAYCGKLLRLQAPAASRQLPAAERIARIRSRRQQGQ